MDLQLGVLLGRELEADPLHVGCIRQAGQRGGSGVAAGTAGAEGIRSFAHGFLSSSRVCMFLFPPDGT